MSPESIFYIYLVALLFSVIVGILKYSYFDGGTKVIFLLLVVTILSEVISRITYHYHFGKNIVYHIDCVIESILMTLYFLKVIKPQKVKVVIFISALVWVSIGIINCLYFQPIRTLDSNVILIENFSIICMALFYLHKILVDDKLTSLFTHHHFAFWVLFLFLSCGTFFFWGYLVMSDRKGKYLDIAQYIQAVINVLVYCGIGIIFMFYPKKISNDIR